MKRKLEKRIVYLAHLVLLVAVLLLASRVLPQQPRETTSTPNTLSETDAIPAGTFGEQATAPPFIEGFGIVAKVIDGDTFALQNGQKVRLIGVDTPETVDPRRPVACFGKEASNVSKELLSGKPVRLEKDISDTDRYGRLLRYVYLQTNNGELFVNNYLVANGFARSSTYPPDLKYQEAFKQSELAARQNNFGLWSSCGQSAFPKRKS